MKELELPEDLQDAMRAAWHRFIDQTAEIRPALHAYCLRLTRNVWDAEDLVQDTMIRAFSTLGRVHDPVRNPKSYLLRIATNSWIDRVRHRQVEAAAPAEELAPQAAPEANPGAVRDAGRTLMQRLAPRERAAILLKDVFDLSLEDSAEVLETTVGAVKAALHRGRERLQEPEGGPASQRPVPARSVVDQFVDLYNAQDKPGLLKLVLDGATLEHMGVGYQYGADQHASPNSWFDGSFSGHPDWPEAWRYESVRAETVLFEGEPIILIHRTRRGKEKLENIVRLREENGRVATIWSYSFTPETIRYVGEQLGMPVLVGPYRYPTASPGVSFGK